MTEQILIPLELRAAETADAHTLTGVCVPYGRVSYRTEHPKGERFLPGAFAGLTNAPAAKVRLTDSHDTTGRRPLGVATRFHESAEGLNGVFRFYDTPEGRGGWENALEGTYGGLSVGFLPLEERTAADGVREVVRARLFHVSLVDEPAYADARVLAVRQEAPAAPPFADYLTPPITAADFPDVPDLAALVWGPGASRPT